MGASRDDRSHHRQDAEPAHAPVPAQREEHERPHLGGAAAALRLQETAGNRAATAALEPPLRVGAAHDPAEAAADALADRVLSRLQPAAAPAAAFPADLHRSTGDAGIAGAFDADPGVAAQIRDRAGHGAALPTDVRRSMEAGFGTSLADVRVHTDPAAASLADSLGAAAFTHGRDVFFGAGRFDPAGAAGQHLLAHELAHVVQGRGGAQRRVHRKLSGTRKAVTDMAGKASLGQKLKGSDYPKILSKLEDYESREAKVLAKKAFGKGDREWMAKTLNDLLALIDGWSARHETAGKRKKHASAVQDASNDTYADAKNDRDYGRMAAVEDAAAGDAERVKLSALALLRPRVAAERQDLMSPTYFASGPRTDSAKSRGGDWNKDNAVGGAMNRLDKVEYQDGKQGFFIRDKVSPMEGADVGTLMGIDKIDPNQGGRSVASSRLAKLFGAQEVVNVEFGTHDSATRYKEYSDANASRKMGVFSQKAEGAEAAEHGVARNDLERQELEKTGAKVIDVRDAELQRGLNVLQMLDYLSRQMDRHMHNVYIATDAEGRVTGVTGIDLDLSFGARLNDGGALQPLGHFVGIPALADAEFRAKVLSVTAGEVKACLEGLISDAEVTATLERLAHLQKVLREMDPKKVVQAGGWGAETAKEQADEATSYLGKLARTSLAETYDRPAAVAYRPLTSAAMGPEKRKIEAAVDALVYAGKLSPGQGLGLIEALVADILTDPTLAQKRTMQAGLRADDRLATQKVADLTKAKAALAEAAGDDASLDMVVAEMELMAAELEKEAAGILKAAADKDYDSAVDTLISTMVDFAVRFGSRQKRAMTPSRRRPVKV